jgi:ferric-dicitrate binding protein FerR (iron transport regulator)
MVPDQNLIAELMTKLARHEVLSAEEQCVLAEWLRESDEHRALAELFQDEQWVAAMIKKMRPERSAKVWEAISRRLDEAGIGAEPRRRQRWIYGAAAAVAALVLIVTTALFFHRQRIPSTVAAGPAEAGPVFMGPRSVRLADKSIFWLDNNSKIRIPGPRHLEFEGRVYGEIAKDPAHPFIIGGPDSLHAEVLGTSLEAEAFAGRPGANLTLITGAVRVSARGHSVDLQPGERAELGAGGLKTVIAKDTGVLLAWLDGARSFHFKHTGLAAAMGQLGDWYQFTVLNPANTPGEPLNYELPKNLSADSAVSVIRLMEKGYADIEKKDDSTYIISASQLSQ